MHTYNLRNEKKGESILQSIAKIGLSVVCPSVCFCFCLRCARQVVDLHSAVSCTMSILSALVANVCCIFAAFRFLCPVLVYAGSILCLDIRHCPVKWVSAASHRVFLFLSFCSAADSHRTRILCRIPFLLFLCSKDSIRWRPSHVGWRPSLLVTRSY